MLELPECASTNSAAADWSAKEAVPDGAVVITSRQFMGRGQRGNAWESEDDANLTFSIILQPRFLPVQEQFVLSQAVALGVVDTLTAIGLQNAKVKWPNDIMIGARKICGILIENQLERNSISRSIAGIGLNVNQVVFQTSHATSVKLETGNETPLSDTFTTLLKNVESRYLQLRGGKAKEIKSAYLDCLHWKLEEHTFSTSGRSFRGTILGLDTNGRLCIETDEGIRVFSVKEVAYID